MKNILYLVMLVIFVTSCKKKDIVQPGVTPVNPVPTNPALLTKDSTLYFTKDIYLWYKQIPASFDPRQYSDPSTIMAAIRQYSTESGFTQPVDRFSFAMKKSEWDNTSSGNEYDFGFGVFFNASNDLRVKYVERESAAGRAGIQRGWQITAINGNTNIDTSSSSINMIVSAVFNSSSGSFTFKKPDGSSANINLTATGYNSHPVFADQVYTISNKKVGYMVFNSFLGDTTDIYNDFSRVFSSFSQNNVSDVIIDLRYNGGGYVTVAEKLANYLVPASANGQDLFTQTFNDKYAHYNETTKVHKLGNVNASRVFFIVSSNTASASEMVINALKPFVETHVVGQGPATYGKPVGFFPIPVGDWYIFPVSFKTVNKNGEGNYYNGIPVEKIVRDGVDKNWGDRNEAALNSVLNYISGGNFLRVETIGEQPARTINGNSILSKNEFKGTIDTRHLK